MNDRQERYSAGGAAELARYIPFESEARIENQSSSNWDNPRKEQIRFLESLGIRTKHQTSATDGSNEKMINLLNKLEDLKVIAGQINNDKNVNGSSND